MWAARLDEGFLFGGIDATTVATLKGVPMLLESSDRRVRDRLLPETCADADDEAQWRQHAVPELERLFLSRAQLVRRDLAGLKKLGGDDLHVLLIVHEHSSAWLAALNAARLALFALNDLSAEHMTDEGFDKLSGRQREAVLRIDLLGSMQAVLIGELQVEDGGSIDDFAIE
ncbi:MAG: DUF2017 family protein [Planctomycetes bacterium]|nr:DUF2017 family protein [Planctomycetota bacterium]